MLQYLREQDPGNRVKQPMSNILIAANSAKLAPNKPLKQQVNIYFHMQQI